jgi:hypothetical protein
MTVERPENRGVRQVFAIYSVVPGWRKVLDNYKKAKPKEQVEMMRVKGIWSGISSVFQMGAV